MTPFVPESAVLPAGPAAVTPAQLYLPAERVRELTWCHEQIGLVYSVTEQLSRLEDPTIIQSTIFEHLSTMLRADATFLCCRDACQRFATMAHADPDQLPDARAVQATLQTRIDEVRRTRAATCTTQPMTFGADAFPFSILLAPLVRRNRDIDVLIALRNGGAAAFDAADVQSAQNVLHYGVQVLDNAEQVHKIQRTSRETVCALVNAIDAKDNYTSDHSERVGALAQAIGRRLGLSRERLQALEWAGLLHDVGKIGVPEHILNKPGKLTAEELLIMRRHPRAGYEMLRPVSEFENVLGAVLHHHENHDGSGYPDGLSGEEIPLEARVVHVADIFDALTTARPYRGSFTVPEALDLIAREAGRVTDPRLADLLHEIVLGGTSTPAPAFNAPRLTVDTTRRQANDA